MSLCLAGIYISLIFPTLIWSYAPGVRAASAIFSSGRPPIVNFTSLQCCGLILAAQTLTKRFLNTSAASAASADYDARLIEIRRQQVSARREHSWINTWPGRGQFGVPRLAGHLFYG